MHLKKAFLSMGKGAVRVLLLGLPAIVFELLGALRMLLLSGERETVALIHTFPLILETILFSLVLVVGGAIVFDLCEKEAEGK